MPCGTVAGRQLMAIRKVLFIGHDASRTGEPIALLTFVRWLKSQGGAHEFDRQSLDSSGPC
jgi:hypothetical protein